MSYMHFYAVIFDRESKGTDKLIEKEWPGLGHFTLNSHVTFIAQEEPSLTMELAKKVGFYKGGGNSGVVIDISVWNGYANSDFVEWIGKVGEM